jgi:mercuric ion transport protein
VTFETREAVVTFDDAKTSVQKLTKATETRAIRPASSSDPLNPNLGRSWDFTASPTKLARLAASFPRWAAPPVSAIASLGAAIGLGFLEEYEGCLFQAAAAVRRRRCSRMHWLAESSAMVRSLLGMIGPAIVLAAVFLFLAIGGRWTALCRPGLDDWGVGLDFISPAIRRCGLPIAKQRADGNSRSHHRKGKIHDHLKITGMTCDSCAARQGSPGESARRAIGAGVLSEGHSATRHRGRHVAGCADRRRGRTRPEATLADAPPTARGGLLDKARDGWAVATRLVATGTPCRSSSLVAVEPRWRRR